MPAIKCADCECTPADCRKSPSPRDCQTCSLDFCCCWSEVNKKNK